jgi:5-formyltetrahydrofolate cyclo-ligase
LDDLVARKSALRRRMEGRRREVTAEQADRVGRAIAEAVVGCEVFHAAQVVALFAAQAEEPSMTHLFHRALTAGKCVALPRSTDDGSLTFHAIRGREDLIPGRYGVLEPVDRPGIRQIRGLDLVIVPGVAFDRSGGRLGRGGGYYDRLAAEVSGQGTMLVGAAFEFQIVKRVPVGGHDQPMNALATEEGMSWPSGTTFPEQGK